MQTSHSQVLAMPEAADCTASKVTLLRDTCAQASPEQTLTSLISHWGLEQRCIFVNAMLAAVSPGKAHHLKGCLARLATLRGESPPLPGSFLSKRVTACMI